MMSITPLGGLCNRMRALDSALSLAQAAGVGLRIRWELSEELNCPLDELFLPIPGIAAVKAVNGFGVTGRLRRRAGEFGRRLAGTRVVTQREVEAVGGDGKAWLAKAAHGRLHVRTHSRFFHGDKDFAAFRLAAPLDERLVAYRPRLAHSVGVHIRTTDNAMSQRHSPLHAFRAQMRAEIEARDDTEFFVATDSPAVVESLRGEFGERIWMHEKQAYERDEPQAIRDAAIDLFGLAGCRSLIGSYWSSFTDTAAALSGKPATIATAAAAA